MNKNELLGGLSWISTAEYYQRLNVLMRDKLGGVASARNVLESVNRQDYINAVIERKDEEAACEIILDACKNLENAGTKIL